MGCMLRSDEMTFCDMYLQPETAFDVLKQLGDMGCVQFTDMSPDMNAFQRNYISEIRRHTELQRKLAYIRDEMRKHDIYVPSLKIDPAALPPHELNLYESLLEKWEEDIRDMEGYQVKLMTNLRALSELYYVLSHIGPILGDVELRRDSIFAKSTAAGDMALSGRLVVKTGVVQRSKCFTFEMMLWRVSRGNIYFRSASVDKVFVDPMTGAEVRKVAFVAICQGDQLAARLEKICTGFHVNVYPCPRTAEERHDMTSKLDKRLHDLDHVLRKTKYHRCKALRSVGRQWWTWQVQVKKAKAIYHIMNLFSLDITSKCLIGQCWVPDHEMVKIQYILETCSEQAGTHVMSFMSKTTTNETPPTYHRTNRFTNGFQALICAYGDSTYRELNPGLYTIITFPFLFAVMFGDCGHAIIMLSFAIWMLANEKKFMEEKSTNEIWIIFFGGRYIVLLMGLFSFYTGFIYNDWFSKPMILGESFWINEYTRGEIEMNAFLTLDPASRTRSPYVFGVDPVWIMSTNKIMFDNSIKMKMSIILGVIHMMFGLCLSLTNHIMFKRYYAIILEFIPQVLFLACLFLWLVVMMYFKWFTYGAKKSDIKLQPGCAPLILILFIDMTLMSESKPVEDGCDAYMFTGQRTVQTALLCIGLISVPILLLGSPIYKQIKYTRAKKTNKLKEDDNHSFGELMITQSIHTIEFVLSTISHTASYLRLWALSLAHAQLSEMLWSMVLAKIGLRDHTWFGGIRLYAVFAIWSAFSVSILVVMEGLSAFLHTLRLHWVEFMSKFYVGGGCVFCPFSFEVLLRGGEDKDPTSK